MKKINILLIDNDKEELRIFEEALAKIEVPHKLFFSDNTTGELYDILRKNNIQIIFLDIDMPLKDGIALLKELKADNKTKHIPVIMYSVSTGRGNKETAAWEVGAYFYLVKPYNQYNLVESLKQIFKVDWTQPQPENTFENFVVNLTFA